MKKSHSRSPMLIRSSFRGFYPSDDSAGLARSSPRELVPPHPRVAAPPAQDRGEDHARHEPPDVRPPRDAAGVSRGRDRPAHELHEEPEAEIERRRHLDDG